MIHGCYEVMLDSLATLVAGSIRFWENSSIQDYYTNQHPDKLIWVSLSWDLEQPRIHPLQYRKWHHFVGKRIVGNDIIFVRSNGYGWPFVLYKPKIEESKENERHLEWVWQGKKKKKGYSLCSIKSIFDTFYCFYFSVTWRHEIC
jgi:hypothetical protein